ncbi:hypothetical protein IG631_19226 [Alternaria alternata]|nr:hypothetical protein IG631_19226 [Alternaria alternata]
MSASATRLADQYQILDVSPDAAHDTTEDAFHRLSRENHPDKATHDKNKPEHKKQDILRIHAFDKALVNAMILRVHVNKFHQGRKR